MRNNIEYGISTAILWRVGSAQIALEVAVVTLDELGTVRACAPQRCQEGERVGVGVSP